MKIAITADEHWHLRKEFDYYTESGDSARLILYYRSFDFVKNICKEKGIKHWLHLGDIVESRESISIPVLHWLGKSLSEIKNENIHQVYLLGNHDSWNRNGNINILQILAEYGDVIADPTVLELSDGIDKVKCNFLPWSEKEEFRDQLNKSESCDLVLTHRMFVGSELDSSHYRMEKGDLCKHLDHSKYKFIFAGHVHKYQKIGDNAYYVGSLLAHSFKEKNIDKGFIIYDSNDNSFEFIKNPFSPIFEKVTFTSIKELQSFKDNKSKALTENLFHDIVLDFKDKEELKEARYIRVDNSRISVHSDNSTSVRVDKASSLSPEKLLETYCKLNNVPERISLLGASILEKVLKEKSKS